MFNKPKEYFKLHKPMFFNLINWNPKPSIKEEIKLLKNELYYSKYNRRIAIQNRIKQLTHQLYNK